MRTKTLSLLLIVIMSVALNYATAASAYTAYRPGAHFDIGGEGGWDYASVDSEDRRLYVSHYKQLEVLDADTGRIVGIVSGTQGVHGAAIAHDLGRGFTSNGQDNSVSIFDLSSLKVIRKVPVNRPDFILYDSFSHRVFPLNEKTTVLDATTGDTVGQVDLGGEPEAAVADGKGTVYVNLVNVGAIAVIDAKSLKVTRRYSIRESCVAPKSLSLDLTNRRLLVGCSNGFRVVDADSGRIVGSSTMCGGVDGGAFDPQSRLVFESCAEGVVSVIRQVTPDVYELAQTVGTQLFAKTMAFDSKTRRIYLPVADLEWPDNSEDARKSTVRSRLVPATFRILVLEP
jgi:hypothetical protein